MQECVPRRQSTSLMLYIVCAGMRTTAPVYIFNAVYCVCRNAYHGASPQLMGLTALNTWRFNVPTGFGFHQVRSWNPCIHNLSVKATFDVMLSRICRGSDFISFQAFCWYVNCRIDLCHDGRNDLIKYKHRAKITFNYFPKENLTAQVK